METYKEFLNRIKLFEIKETDYGNNYFHGNPQIAEKVNEDNTFKDFYGDTIVFNLDDAAKEKLANQVKQLYQLVPECFCEKLSSHTFHMTLHDLSNSSSLQNIASEILENQSKYPINKQEYHELINLYTIFEDVRKLNYPLTPHITLAYYNRNGFDTKSARKLESLISKLNRDHMEIELDIHQLVYQKFTSMNDYIDIVPLDNKPALKESMNK